MLGPQRGDAIKDNTLERRTGICGAFAMNAMAFSLPTSSAWHGLFMFAKWFDLVAAISATLALFIGGSYFAERSWRSLRAGVLHIDTPITLGILAAYIGSLVGWVGGIPGLKYFDFVAMFIFLMLGGRWVQQAAVARNRRMLLRDPSIAETVIVAGNTITVGELKAGDHFDIKPGQAMPVAAELCDRPTRPSALNGSMVKVKPSNAAPGNWCHQERLTSGHVTLRQNHWKLGSTAPYVSSIEARRGGAQRDLEVGNASAGVP